MKLTHKMKVEFTLNEQIDHMNGVIDRMNNDLKYARRPERKKQIKGCIAFFKSLLKSLKRLQSY